MTKIIFCIRFNWICHFVSCIPNPLLCHISVNSYNTNYPLPGRFQPAGWDGTGNWKKVRVGYRDPVRPCVWPNHIIHIHADSDNHHHSLVTTNITKLTKITNISKITKMTRQRSSTKWPLRLKQRPLQWQSSQVLNKRQFFKSRNPAKLEFWCAQS